MGTFFELGKDKAAKGEGWAPPFISCAQDTVGLKPPSNPPPLRLLGYGKPLPAFYSISAISGRWLSDTERLCAMEPRLRSERFPPQAETHLL